MAGYYPEEWLDALRARCDIVDVISGYVRLQPRGRRHLGLCPFHSEKTPSFSVDADKQFYYCFGCKAGGDVFNFVMNMEKLTFSEAVEMLADRVGMQVPETVKKSDRGAGREQKERLYAAVREAARYYHAQLQAPIGRQAKAYLLKRGLQDAGMKKFGLGYAPRSGAALLQHLQARGFTPEELVKAGLCIQRNGRMFDFFRDRVIFPVIDPRGRVLGFGARLLSGDGPKYINTSDTPIYNKRDMLYGINFHKTFDNSRNLILVEGYMDLVSVSLAGFPNVVASLGTALTPGQARLARRYADRVLFTYDADASGTEAMLRGASVMEAEGLEVRIVRFPDCKDPDEYIRKYGPQAFQTALDQAFTVTGFQLDLLKRKCDFRTDDGRTAYAVQGAALAAARGPVEAERYYRQIAEETGFSFEAVKQQATLPTSEKPLRKRVQPKEQEDAGTAAERLLLAVMAAQPASARLAFTLLKKEDFTGRLEAELFLLMQQLSDKGDFAVSDILGRLAGEDMTQAAGIFASDTQGVTPDAVTELSVRIRTERLLRERDKLLQESAGATSERKKEIAKQIADYDQRITALRKGALQSKGVWK